MRTAICRHRYNPKISLLLVLSQINTIASFIKVKISDFQTRFTMKAFFKGFRKKGEGKEKEKQKEKGRKKMRER